MSNSILWVDVAGLYLPMPVSYDVGLTVLSLLVAMAVTGIGFYVIGTRQATALQLALSGLFMGIGIVAMHYTGMAAMRMPAEIRYDRLFLALSVFIAIGASIAALWLADLATGVVVGLLILAIVLCLPLGDRAIRFVYAGF